MGEDILGYALTLMSVMAIAIPLFALGRSVLRALFPSEVIIRDRDGRIMKQITKESLAQEKPGEMERLYHTILRQQRNATTAP